MRPHTNRAVKRINPFLNLPPMKFQYVGKEPLNLAQVGLVKPGQTIEVNAELGAGIQRHAPEQFERLPDTAPVQTEGISAKPVKSGTTKPEVG